MKEVIAYDKNGYFGSDKVFYTISEIVKEGISVYYNTDGELIFFDICDDGEYTSPEVLSFDIFDFIEKTDADRNKIYADSSIVKIGDDSRGVVYLDERSDMYKFAFNNDKEVSTPFWDISFAKLKIIGTLQESPNFFNNWKIDN